MGVADGKNYLKKLRAGMKLEAENKIMTENRLEAEHKFMTENKITED